MNRSKSGLRLLQWTASVALLLSLPAMAGGWDINWWTIDSGGEVLASGGAWELSGTIGQWDATSNGMQSGGAWKLTGGFWSLDLTEADRIFRDRFQAD
jgi:hypothetical protein